MPLAWHCLPCSSPEVGTGGPARPASREELSPTMCCVGEGAGRLSPVLPAVAIAACAHPQQGRIGRGHAAGKEPHTGRMEARGPAHCPNPPNSQHCPQTEIITPLSLFSLFPLCKQLSLPASPPRPQQPLVAVRGSAQGSGLPENWGVKAALFSIF